MAISMHLAGFHKTIKTIFYYEALFAYVSCILKTLGPINFSNIALHWNGVKEFDRPDDARASPQGGQGVS